MMTNTLHNCLVCELEINIFWYHESIDGKQKGKMLKCSGCHLSCLEKFKTLE